MKRILTLLSICSIVLLFGCATTEQRITSISLNELEGSWSGDLRNEYDLEFGGGRISDNKRTNPSIYSSGPSVSRSRKFCDAKIVALNSPIEGFTHGIVLDFENIKGNTISGEPRGRVGAKNILAYVLKETNKEIVIHEIKGSSLGATGISKKPVDVQIIKKKGKEILRLHHFKNDIHMMDTNLKEPDTETTLILERNV